MIITALGESMLAMESLITHVDAIITHSCDKHLCNEADQDLEEAAVVGWEGRQHRWAGG